MVSGIYGIMVIGKNKDNKSNNKKNGGKMLAYLGEARQRLVALKNGMTKYPTSWTSQSVQVQEVEQMISSIDAKNAEVNAIKQEASLKVTESHELSGSANKLADKIENLAWGFHSGSEEKLVEYGIKTTKTYTPKPAPTKVLIPELAADTDGEGFIINTQVDTNADYYEWQKGVGANAADDRTIPVMENFKTTKKTRFVDDDVQKGVRIFYRVRAANSNGVGPWSEAVSKVQ